MSHESLHLHEEALLLALHNRKGTVMGGSNIEFLLAGAIVAELLLEKRASVETDRRRKFVILTSAEPLGDPLMDECLGRIAQARRRATIDTWVARIAGLRKLKERAAERLCTLGIVRCEATAVLAIFSRTTYPAVDPEPEREIRDRLHKAIFEDSDAVDPRTAVLVSLARAADLLGHLFGRREIRGRRARIDQIVNGDLVGKATREAIDAMDAAIWVACIVPALYSTS